MKYRKNIPFRQRLTYGYFQFFDQLFGRERFFNWTRKHRTNFYRKLRSKLSEHGPGRVIQVERFRDLSKDDLHHKYIRQGLPVVIEGAASTWPCTNLWTPKFFKDKHGSDQVVMLDQTDISKGYTETTLANIIDDIRGGGNTYYRFYPLLDKHPEHLLELDYDWLRSHRKKPCLGDAFHVFISGKGGFTPLHNANTPNIFVQVYGEKKWILFHHHYTAVVDPSPVRNMYRSAPIRNGVDFNPFENNFKDYPLYQYVDRYEVHLKPGDVLFNPPFMWHAVTNPTDSIGIGYRTFSPFYSFQTSFLYSWLELWAKNPPIWKTYKTYADINLIHLKETGLIKELERKKGKKITSSVS